ncbi:MAG TPA: NAD(P)H-hydrate dehydratase [Capsulimonadaceae bacterium]|nr:NAD(P)H-hydrate dehydratase [Capsulimonadaceae bacterium]
MKVVTSAEMRAMDKKVIKEYGVPSLVLMENAALRVVEEIVKRYAPIAGKKIGVVCGKGNNGGDGIGIARHLATRYGVDVLVWLAEGDQKLSPDTDAQLKMGRSFGLDVQAAGEGKGLAESLGGCDVIVDAVLGTGIQGDPRADAAQAILAINNASKPVVAVDVPSGLNCDNGRVGNPTVKADVTVTFAFSKLGLHLFPGLEYAGEVVVGDLGFPQEARAAGDVHCDVTDKAMVAGWLPSRKENENSNKGQYGSVAVFAGSAGYAGAPSLAAEGATRAGAGLVTLGCPQAIFDIMMARLPETLMTRAFAANARGSFDSGAVDDALAFCEKMDAVALGPGIGHDEESTRRFVYEFVARCEKPLVLDADALNALALQSDHGAALVKARKAPTVLTPHPGEMGRLLGKSTKEVQADRLVIVREAADRFGCATLLKGTRTLIAHPDGRLAINETGNTGMATGGMGDALTGITGAFLAQMGDAWQAAAAAAYVHGLAGDLAASQIGKAGLLAPDLLRFVPAAIQRCAEAVHREDMVIHGKQTS